MPQEPVAPILEMRGVGKSFAGIPALIDVDFAARAGEVHSIVGQNGAGKSTLMDILAGVVRPDTARSGSPAQPSRSRMRRTRNALASRPSIRS